MARTLIYYDLRIRREGYDIEKLMEAAGLAETEATVSAGSPAEMQGQETDA